MTKQAPSTYDRLCAARVVRPLCWGQEKPHIFKHEGIWRISLVPMPPPRRLDPRTKVERRAISKRWVDAYHWVAQMECEGRP